MDASRNPLNHCRCFAEPVFPAILCKIRQAKRQFSSSDTVIECRSLNCFTNVIRQAASPLPNFSRQRAQRRFSRPVHPRRLRREPVHRR
ncbi:hypothetical protein F9K77_00885 [Ochrobactrum sp. LMG 5442]|nr:hypothetical protein F9K77_00885 [Ochrobactrum sp. LMG 5442]